MPLSELSEMEELKKENARLRKFIDLLLEKMEQLDISSSDKTAVDGKTITSASHILAFKGKASISASYKTALHGNMFMYPSDKIAPHGKTRTSASDKEQFDGKTGLYSSQISWKNEEPIAPFAFEPSPKNIKKLAQHVNLRGRHRGKERIAHLLLHFGNGGHGANDTLRHLLGLSETGVTKLIHRMKKQGMVERVRFHQYLLTAQAKDWISAVLGP